VTLIGSNGITIDARAESCIASTETGKWCGWKRTASELCSRADMKAIG